MMTAVTEQMGTLPRGRMVGISRLQNICSALCDWFDLAVAPHPTIRVR